MQNTWKSRIVNKVVNSIPDLAQNMLNIVNEAGPLAQSVVRDTLEMTVFPWYEAATGTDLSNKTMRQAVADRIHESLVNVVFVPKDDSKELSNNKFRVMTVLPAYKGDSEYDIIILMAPVDNRQERIQCNLMTLLCNFSPIEEIKYRDYDA